VDLVIVGSGPVALKNERGHSLGETAHIAFSTGLAFVPEDPPIPPRLAALPEVNQVPRNRTPDFEPDPRDPALAPLFDPEGLSITLSFSETMDPRRVNPFSTIALTNVTPGYELRGTPVLGRIESNPALTRFTFVPVFPLGDDPLSSDPFLFRVS